ncbi:hypothetical protein J5U18_03420 [Sphingobacteriaceae bacterium WQ 2009]|uniref:Uncharacterized protein n=1 Tax=Rhinopithecimicrobium faecis TaxID=2820698 RepID=A0A8T4H628_9SPHI|nr:hypothetical protein [Sphingobacteriaceae bacterium WQ 2009]
MKILYMSPRINVLFLQHEHSIATGSATVTPVNSNNVVESEWDVQPDDIKTIDW